MRNDSFGPLQIYFCWGLFSGAIYRGTFLSGVTFIGISFWQEFFLTGTLLAEALISANLKIRP